MKISLNNLGKRYNREWIFRNLSFQFNVNKHYAITGPNGSGKSTLLQIIGGSAIYNEGEIFYHESDTPIEPEKIFKKISFAAPYIDLIEEMTLKDFFIFHKKIKEGFFSFKKGKFFEPLALKKFSKKKILFFSR